MKNSKNVIIIVFSFFLVTFGQVTRNVEVTASEEKVRDKLGYQAIREIHQEMDDDHSGSIDRTESAGFMKEDMNMRGTERTRKENKFHGDDDAITVDDMWQSWFESDERNWSNERLVEWLMNDVNLTIVAEIIKKERLDGKALPRFATQNPDFLIKDLGIKSSGARRKLRHNALDVVLFGYKHNNNKTKDILLALLALLLTTLLFLYIRQQQKAKRKVQELHKRLKELKSMETELEDFQKKVEVERSKRSTADGNVNQIEIENLRVQLEEAEKRLEANSNGSGTPLALQPLLRRTCENEMMYLEKQRQDCFKEMKEAIEMVDRLQKKQGSVLSSLKLATGASSTSDQVDSKIFALKNRMEKIHGLTRETQERWMQIESLCGFPVLYMNETDHIHRSASSNHFYNNNNSAKPTTSSMTSSEGNHPRTRKFAESTSSSSVSNMVQTRPKLAATNMKFASSNKSNGSMIEKTSSSHEMEEEASVEKDEMEEMTSTTVRPQEANIVFQSKPIADDLRSIETLSSVATSNGVEPKKKRSIFPKIFRKGTSKSSMISNSSS